MTSSLSSVEEKVKEEFKKWFFDGSPQTLNILITGKTGVGKSRLVNALVGHKVAAEGHEKDPCTSEVTSYEVKIEGVTVTVWDSPGLQDGTTNEDQYIQDMKNKIKDISLMIYCIRMDDTRLYEADKEAIQILTDEFGKKVWSHAVVVLTFANKVEDPDGEDESEYFKSQIYIWKKQFKDYFAVVGVKPEICGSIPVIPAGNTAKSMRLPDRENWLSDLWIECYQGMKASARRGMYQINKTRLKLTSAPSNAISARHEDDEIPREIPLNEEQEKSFWKSIWDGLISAVDSVPEEVWKTGWQILKSYFSKQGFI